MKKTIISPAKINLCLDIIKKNEDGYHEIRTILHEIPELYDVIHLEEIPSGIEIEFKGEEAHLIDKENNTILKAFELIKPSKGYRVTIEKNIPLGAGLGGGSSNAARILMEFGEKEEIGSKIGMDVPFFFLGGTTLGEHYGEKLTHMKTLNLDEYKKVFIIHGQRKQTKKMYMKVKLSETNKSSDKTDALIKAIENEKSDQVVQNMHNDFEFFTDPWFLEIKEKLKEHGAIQSVLCGAGTAVFALFPKDAFSKKSDFEALSQALPHQRILNLPQSEDL